MKDAINNYQSYCLDCLWGKNPCVWIYLLVENSHFEMSFVSVPSSDSDSFVLLGLQIIPGRIRVVLSVNKTKWIKPIISERKYKFQITGLEPSPLLLPAGSNVCQPGQPNPMSQSSYYRELFDLLHLQWWSSVCHQCFWKCNSFLLHRKQQSKLPYAVWHTELWGMLVSLSVHGGNFVRGQVTTMFRLRFLVLLNMKGRFLFSFLWVRKGSSQIGNSAVSVLRISTAKSTGHSSLLCFFLDSALWFMD